MKKPMFELISNDPKVALEQHEAWLKDTLRLLKEPELKGNLHLIEIGLNHSVNIRSLKRRIKT